ncbi:Lrp/AsnC family transcriptional regulator [Methylibium sp.]|uniref:Lrp/AsnC family transcriptional regulator n=1 Tax=Methylibium sp. TaxID=2067992 RepID=UPI0017F27AAD|nr:Lrp/AsnC family transcriptional regulator [Methylibium sp.]MBA3589785.1 Lrp/AsnC family transcriptional regulator [Methylibium sp.]
MKPDSRRKLDQIDKKILLLLQEDALLPVQEIAARVNLSTTPCWRRIQQLREWAVIKQHVAILDPAKVNLPVSVFVGIKTSQHNAPWLDKFARSVKQLPEVLEFYRMSGDVDYLLRVVVPDIGGYDVFYKKLIKVAELTDVSSSFAMEQIKYTTALPLDHV